MPIVYMNIKNFVMLCIYVNDLTKVYRKTKKLLSNILLFLKVYPGSLYVALPTCTGVAKLAYSALGAKTLPKTVIFFS